jgi:regulator of nucleoside diphosphate kinase
MTANRTDLIIGRRDLGRLDTLLGGSARGSINKVRSFLVGELARARIVDDVAVPPTVVAMHSTLEFRDDETGRRMVAKLVYPGEGSGPGQVISVLTPVGAALIGLSEGQSISYETPDGRLKTLTVLRVLSRDSYEGARNGPRLTRRSLSAF